MGGTGSGGHNKKPAAEHKKTGTYRPDRHDPKRRKAQQAERASPVDDLTMAQIIDLSWGPENITSEYGLEGFKRTWGPLKPLDNMRRVWKSVRPYFMPHPDFPDGPWNSPLHSKLRRDQCHHAEAGTRPFAWWNFERKESMPATRSAQAKRLQALGELAPWEKELVKLHLHEWEQEEIEAGA